MITQLVDRTRVPNIVRQRASCETVQTLVGLVEVEVFYIRAVDGVGVVPFLEGARRAGTQPPLAGPRRPRQADAPV